MRGTRIFFYQYWCGDCHSRGFPTLQALVQDLFTKGCRGRRSPDRILRSHARQATLGPATLRPPDSLGRWKTTAPVAHRGSLPSTLTEWSLRMDSPSTSVGLSERSLKRDRLPGDVCDAFALSPISMREGPSILASALPCHHTRQAVRASARCHPTRRGRILSATGTIEMRLICLGH